MKKIFYWRFSRKIEGEFWIFYKRFPWEKNWMEEIFEGISLKNWSWIHTRASLKTFFDPRYRPPTPVLVDSEVRGTTLQKLIVDSEVRGTTLQKLIVDSEVRGTTLQKLIVVGEVRGTTPPS